MPAPSGSFRSRRTAAGCRSPKMRRPSPTEAAARVWWPRARSSSTHVRRTASSSSMMRVAPSRWGMSGAWYHRAEKSGNRSPRRPRVEVMRLNGMRPLAFRLFLAGGLLSAGCYSFHQTGPEDASPVVRPMLVDVTVEYRQPNLCFASDHCDDLVVFFASWLPMQVNPQGQPSGGFMFLQRVSAYMWRGVAHNVPVNYPPKDDPHVVAIY